MSKRQDMTRHSAVPYARAHGHMSVTVRPLCGRRQRLAVQLRCNEYLHYILSHQNVRPTAQGPLLNDLSPRFLHRCVCATVIISAICTHWMSENVCVLAKYLIRIRIRNNQSH